MKREITVIIIIIVLFLIPQYAFAGNCDEGKYIANTDKCKDSDNGKNYLAFGICLDSKNWDSEYKDKCDGGTLKEWYCSESGTCIPTGRICQNGCSNDRCNPEGTIINYPRLGCDDTDNGIFFYKAGTCTQGMQSGGTQKENRDKCNGNYLTEYYCSESYDTPDRASCPEPTNRYSLCLMTSEYCDFGCNVDHCNSPDFGAITVISPTPVDNTNTPTTPIQDSSTFSIACCLNPDEEVCSEKTKTECCPEDGKYNLKGGPSGKKDCEDNFFVTGPDKNAPCLKLTGGSCEIVCCCERTYDENDNEVVTARADVYKTGCAGNNKIISEEGCSSARCQALFAAAPAGDENGNGEDTDDQAKNKFKESCKSGECSSGLVCLEDFDMQGKKICCKEKQCLAQGECFNEGEFLYRKDNKFICLNSKWILIGKSYAAQRIIEKDDCLGKGGICRGGFLTFRRTTALLGFRNGNFCNSDERDFASCGNTGFLGVEQRCCIPLS